MVKKAENLMSAMLSETILALCRNTLSYKDQFSIDCLMGITLDNEEIFLVNIKETINKAGRKITSAIENTSKEYIQQNKDRSSASDEKDKKCEPGERKRRKRKRKRSQEKVQRDDGSGESDSDLPCDQDFSPGPDVDQIKKERMDSEEEEEEECTYLGEQQSSFGCDSSGYGLSESGGDMDAVLGQLPNLSYHMNSNVSPSNALMPSASSNEFGHMAFTHPDLSSTPRDSGDYMEGMSHYLQSIARSSLDSPTANQGSKSYKCQICSRVLSRKDHLNRHMKVHATETSPREKKFECDLCDKKYADRGSLTIHKRLHTGEMPFQCQFCGRAFRDRKPLRQHVRIHTGEKPYECQFCRRRFTQNGHKIIHERLHTGEKPYSCEFCGVSFSSLAHVRNHNVRNQCQKQLKTTSESTETGDGKGSQLAGTSENQETFEKESEVNVERDIINQGDVMRSAVDHHSKDLERADCDKDKVVSVKEEETLCEEHGGSLKQNK